MKNEFDDMPGEAWEILDDPAHPKKDIWDKILLFSVVFFPVVTLIGFLIVVFWR